MRQSLLLNIVSQILAVALISFPLAFMGYSLDQETKRNATDLSHQEFADFVTRSLVDSVGEAFLTAFVVVILLVAVVEPVAFGFRWIFLGFKRKKSLN